MNNYGLGLYDGYLYYVLPSIQTRIVLTSRKCIEFIECSIRLKVNKIVLK